MPFFHKRLISVWLAILMAFAAIPALAVVEYNAPGEEPNPNYHPAAGSLRVIEALPEGKLNAICVEGDDVYLLEQDVLWRADDELNKLKQIHSFSEDLCGFSVSDGQFYFSFVDEDRTVFARLTEDGQTDRLFDVPAERPMFKMLAAEGHIFVLWLYSGYENQMHILQSDWEGCELDVYSLDGELRIGNLFDGAVDMAYRAEYGLILLPDFSLWAGTELNLPTWNIQTGQFGELKGFSFGGKKLAVMPDGNGFFVCDDGAFFDLYRYESGRYTTVQQAVGDCMDPGWADAALACTRTRLYCYRLRGDMNLHSLELSLSAPSGDASQTVLTIAYQTGDSIDSDPVIFAAQECFQ